MATPAAQTHLTPEEYIAIRVEHYRRQERQWIFTDFQKREEILPLISIQCELPIQEIYELVTFPD